MNSTLCVSTDAELNSILNCTTEFDVFENTGDNATTPMASVLPPYQQWSEEELHTSFEQAISGRVTQVHERLSRISSAHIPTYRAMRNTNPIVVLNAATDATKRHLPLFSGIQQRYIIFVSFALICMMAGFDLMGLLVLHVMH